MRGRTRSARESAGDISDIDVSQRQCSDWGAAAVAVQSEVQRCSVVLYLQHQEPDDVSCNLGLKIPRFTQRNAVLVHQKSAVGAFGGVARGTCARGHFFSLGKPVASCGTFETTRTVFQGYLKVK